MQQLLFISAKFFPKSLIYNDINFAKFIPETMKTDQKDDKNDIKRALYWSNNYEHYSHHTRLDNSGECIAKQYEWSEEHESLGGGNFLRKNITSEDIDAR
jgi:hypothetical protein